MGLLHVDTPGDGVSRGNDSMINNRGTVEGRPRTAGRGRQAACGVRSRSGPVTGRQRSRPRPASRDGPGQGRAETATVEPPEVPVRSNRLLPLLAAGALVLGACGGGGESVDTGAGGGGEGGDTLVAAVSARPDQFDPHVTTAYPSFQVLENVYDTLVVPNAEDLTMEPSLAESWETRDRKSVV